MRVRVSFTVDIDPESWTLNYGVEGAEAIRADVRVYAEEAARNQFAAVGVLREEE